MDTLRLRTAAGDAARSAQSVLRSAAADPERLAAELAEYQVMIDLTDRVTDREDHSADSLRTLAREHVLFAVAYMDAARQAEGGAS